MLSYCVSCKKKTEDSGTVSYKMAKNGKAKISFAFVQLVVSVNLELLKHKKKRFYNINVI